MNCLSPMLFSSFGQTPTSSCATALAMTAGSVTWTFPVPFSSTPIIHVTPVGAPALADDVAVGDGAAVSASATLYLSAVSATAVTIGSTYVSDARTVHITAIGNPK